MLYVNDISIKLETKKNKTWKTNHLKGLLMQSSGHPLPYKGFWCSRSGVKPENLHFQQIPGEVDAAGLVPTLWESLTWMPNPEDVSADLSSLDFSRELKTKAKFPGQGVCLGDDPRKPWERLGDERKWRGEEEEGCLRDSLPPSGAKSHWGVTGDGIDQASEFSQQGAARAMLLPEIGWRLCLSHACGPGGAGSGSGSGDGHLEATNWHLLCGSGVPGTGRPCWGADRHGHAGLLGNDIPLGEINDTHRNF